MKTFLLFILLFLFFSGTLFAQVGISTHGDMPDPSAMLDVKSTSKGMLVPRMTAAQRNAISSPATGLLIYCTDDQHFYSNKGTPATPDWEIMSSQWISTGSNLYYPDGKVGIGTSLPVGRLHVSDAAGTNALLLVTPMALSSGDSASLLLAEDHDGTFGMYWMYDGLDNELELWGKSGTTKIGPHMLVSRADGDIAVGGAIAPGYKLSVNGSAQFDKVGVNSDNSTPDASAMLDVKSTSKGILPPRMTFAQRNQIASPAEGLIVFCTNCRPDGTGCISLYFAGQWLNLAGSCDLPVTPQEGIHVETSTQITWNWNTVPIASGYKWYAVNNFAAATDMGTATSHTETGLTQGYCYKRYVWAYNGCGYSDPVVMTGQALVCGNSFTRSHGSMDGVAPVSKTVTYGTVTNIPGETAKCWITRNLGATQQPNTVDDDTEASAGWYWQFNRKQGYMHDGTTLTPSWNSGTINEDMDWQTENDPCYQLLGSAWRIPTHTEWTNVDVAGNWTNWNGPFGSALQMHAAGGVTNGALTNRGMTGTYLSSTQATSASSLNATALIFSNSSSYTNSLSKTHARPLRCVRDH